MEGTIEESRGLPQLLNLLIDAVTNLDDAGADAWQDMYLYVSGVRGGVAVTEVAIEQGRMWIAAAGQPFALPRYVRADGEANRRALLFAELCYAMWHWRVGRDEVADYLGCGSYLLDRWIGADGATTAPDLPAAIAQRARRLVVIEQQRLIAGVPDGSVGDWLRAPRADLGRRSIIDLVWNDGEVGFRRVGLWLLDSVAARSATVH